MPVQPHITIDTRRALSFLRGLPNVAAKAQQRTLSDVNRSLPGKISGAVSEEYAIRKGHVARAFNAKAATRRPTAAAVSVRGKDLESAIISIRGKKISAWKTKGTPRPQKVSGGAFSSKRKYTVTQQIKKGHPTNVLPDATARIFLYTKDGKKLAMKIKRGAPPAGRGKNFPYPFAATSVPQAVRNPSIVAKWQPFLENLIITRLRHHALVLSRITIKNQ